MFTFPYEMLNKNKLVFLNHSYMYRLFYMFNIFHNILQRVNKYIDAE